MIKVNNTLDTRDNVLDSIIINTNQNDENDIPNLDDNGHELETTLDTDITTIVTGEYTVKQRTIEEDQKENLFPDTICTPFNKRKGNHKLFKEEEIDYNIYQINKCGFTTNRPLAWAKGMETLIAVENLDAKWTYLKESGFYNKCEIVIIHEKKKLTMLIQIKAGFVTVQGQSFKEWLELYFAKIKEALYKSDSILLNSSPNENGEEMTSNVLSPTKTQDVVTKDYDRIWESDDEIRNALNTQDSVIQKIIDRCQELELKLANLNSNQLTENIEKSLDIRLTSLIEVIYQDMEKKLSEMKNHISSKIHEINNKVENIHQHCVTLLVRMLYSEDMSN